MMSGLPKRAETPEALKPCSDCFWLSRCIRFAFPEKFVGFIGICYYLEGIPMLFFRRALDLKKGLLLLLLYFKA